MESSQTASSINDTQPVQTTTTRNRPRHRKTRTGCFNCKRRRIKKSRRHVAIASSLAIHLEANGGNNSSLSVPAMTYRCKAIQLFRKAVASFQEPEPSATFAAPKESKHTKPRKSAKIAGDPRPQTDSQHYGHSIRSFDQGSALVASCYLLMGQSQYLGDGIQDFMTLTRGSASLRGEMIRLGFPPLLQNLEPKDSIETMRRYLQAVAPLDKPWIDSGETSLDTLRLTCADGLQLAYLASVESIVAHARTDALKVYTSVMGHFIWWQGLQFEEFQRIIDLTDQVNVLLATHWVALMMAMVFLRKASVKINDDSKKKAD